MPSIGVCARVKDEQNIIREWVRHYIRLGFERIVIYDDGSNPPVKETLADCVDSKVVIIDSPTANQPEAYSDGMSRCSDLDWMLLCDADEFLWTDGRAITDYLAAVPDAVGTVLVHWLTYGTSGIQKMAPDVSIFRQFTRREPYGSGLNAYVKSIVRTRMENTHIWVHVSCSPDRAITEANGTPITDRAHCQHHEATAIPDLATMPLLLVHYMTLDWENMARKAVRNKALANIGPKYTPAWYQRMFTDSVQDLRMLKYV